jgi:hypothetical protein
MSEEASKLAGIIDGVTMTDDAAKLLWKEFSEHMDANRGDMIGYAKKRGWSSVLPEYRGGKAVLIVKTTANARGPAPVAAPQKAKPKPQQKAAAKPQQKAAAKPQPKPAAKPQPKPAAKPQAKPAAKPPQKVAPKPQVGQKAPQKPGQPASPGPRNGGGQAPPKKRPS